MGSGKKQTSCLGFLLWCLGIVVFFVGAAVALVWGPRHFGDQSDLSRSVQVTAISWGPTPSEHRSEHHLDYTYEYEGRHFRNDLWIDRLYARPPRAPWVCVDPKNPARHAFKKLSGGKDCGDKNIGRDATATEVPAPGGG